jgi:hypothetical protein
MQSFERENLFNNSDRYIPENQQQNAEIPSKQPVPELNIYPASDQSPAISASGQEENGKETAASTPTVQKQIRKIVFFYVDKTFEEYYPEK